MTIGQIVSENYFKYDNSAQAQLLRKIYGKDGYKKYTAKMYSIMSNPIAESKEKYIQEKKEQYLTALANFKKSNNVWNEYKGNYYANLTAARQQNNGLSLNGTQRQSALQNSGDGAVKAYQNFHDAEFEKDYAFSLYNDATHSGLRCYA